MGVLWQWLQMRQMQKANVVYETQKTKALQEHEDKTSELNQLYATIAKLDLYVRQTAQAVYENRIALAPLLVHVQLKLLSFKQKNVLSPEDNDLPDKVDRLIEGFNDISHDSLKAMTAAGTLTINARMYIIQASDYKHQLNGTYVKKQPKKYAN